LACKFGFPWATCRPTPLGGISPRNCTFSRRGALLARQKWLFFHFSSCLQQNYALRRGKVKEVLPFSVALGHASQDNNEFWMPSHKLH